MITKAVILAAGKGTRMQKSLQELEKEEREKLNPIEGLVEKGLRGLIPGKNGRPFLDYSVERLVNSGYKHLCFVVKPEHEEFEEFRQACIKKYSLSIDFTIQQKQLGTADALHSARDFACKRFPDCYSPDFIMLNSDDIYSEKALKKIGEAEDYSYSYKRYDNWYAIGYEQASLIKNSNIPHERIKKFGIMKVNFGFLEDIIEKPENPEDYAHNGKIIVNMNLFRFNHSIFDACENIPPSSRGEYEITDAVRFGIRHNARIRVLPTKDGVIDLTYINDIETAEETLKHSKNEEGDDYLIEMDYGIQLKIQAHSLDEAFRKKAEEAKKPAGRIRRVTDSIGGVVYDDYMEHLLS